MSDPHATDDGRTPAPDDPPANGVEPSPAAAEDDAPDTQGAAEATDDEAPSPERRIEQLRDDLEQANARLLRVSADYQNFVRRSQQGAADAREQQLMSVARAMLPVLDHFELALGVDAESSSAADVLAGVQIVRDELMNVLGRFGVERLDVSAGDEFDPNRHEALMRQASEEVASNHVVSQLQPGYLLGTRTLRAAQVAVAE